jgi:glycosyltransferase involved in cell wall biosynthesis
MTGPTISVVIPTFNSGSVVTQAVESALGQTSQPHEIIVVDDGSTDDTQSELRQFQQRIVSLRQQNAGVAAARNAGIARATGDFVAFLDADDVWHPKKLAFQIQSLQDHRPALGAVGTDTFDWPRVTMPEIAVVAPASTIECIDWDSLVVKNCLTTSSMLVRRDVLRKAGTFDTALQGPEDYDLWLRVAEIANVGVLPMPLTGYRNAEGSLSKHAEKMEEGMIRILDKLDRRDAWKGRWLLRRSALGYANYSCGYMYAAAGEPVLGLNRVFRSLVWYPFPYRRGTLESTLARTKLLMVLLLSALGVRKKRFGHEPVK